MYDQVARNRMREKLTASMLFKNRKTSYPLRLNLNFEFVINVMKMIVLFNSVAHPFVGDYVRLRQNVQWKKLCMSLNDQYIVFADIVNKITRSTGKVSKIIFFSSNKPFAFNLIII